MIPIIGISVWAIVKVFFLIALGLYILFSLIVIRQIQLMTDTLEVGFEAPIRLVGLIHLVVAISVFVLALLILNA